MSPRSRAASVRAGVPERRDVYERLADELREDDRLGASTSRAIGCLPRWS